MYKVILTDTAKIDLKEYRESQALYNSPDYARNYFKELIEKAYQNLFDFPYSYTIFNHKQMIRRMVYKGDYNIYYSVNETLKAVYILHVVHCSGSRNEIIKSL